MGDHPEEVLPIALHHIVDLVGGGGAAVLVHLAVAGQDHLHLVMVKAHPGVVVPLMELQSVQERVVVSLGVTPLYEDTDHPLLIICPLGQTNMVGKTIMTGN